MSVESSSVTLVASMLISPIMGPILAGVFGAVVGDSKLRNLGVVNELLSLVICLVWGFVMGLVVCPWIEWGGVERWPTQEMVSRGLLRCTASLTSSSLMSSSPVSPSPGPWWWGCSWLSQAGLGWPSVFSVATLVWYRYI